MPFRLFQSLCARGLRHPSPTPDAQNSNATIKADGRTFSESELHQIAQFRNDLALHHPDIIYNTDHLPAGHQYDQLTADVARCLQRDLHRVYPHEPTVPNDFSHNTRYTVSSLRSSPPSQSNWVHHVFGLLRLRSTLSAHHVNALQQHVSHANGGTGQHGANRLTSTLQIAISQLQGCDVSDALLKLYLHDTRAHRRGSSHNTHLSSVALQTVTGLIYHPVNNLVESPAHGQALPAPLIENHPGSFKQFPFVLLTRYCNALKLNRLDDFFNSAFIRQRPCYEDIQENTLNYGGVETHDHPRPAWNSALDLNDNLLGQFAWVQRQALIRKLNAAGRDTTQLSAHDWDVLESSPAFAEELRQQADLLWLQVRESIPLELHTEAHQLLLKYLD